jgi:hypothetical protein
MTREMQTILERWDVKLRSEPTKVRHLVYDTVTVVDPETFAIYEAAIKSQYVSWKAASPEVLAQYDYGPDWSHWQEIARKDGINLPENVPTYNCLRAFGRNENSVTQQMPENKGYSPVLRGQHRLIRHDLCFSPQNQPLVSRANGIENACFQADSHFFRTLLAIRLEEMHRLVSSKFRGWGYITSCLTEATNGDPTAVRH